MHTLKVTKTQIMNCSLLTHISLEYSLGHLNQTLLSFGFHSQKSNRCGFVAYIMSYISSYTFMSIPIKCHNFDDYQNMCILRWASKNYFNVISPVNTTFLNIFFSQQSRNNTNGECIYAPMRSDHTVQLTIFSSNEKYCVILTKSLECTQTNYLNKIRVCITNKVFFIVQSDKQFSHQGSY